MLTAQFPIDLIEQVLFETERVSERERDLPAHVMMYYTIALALYAEVSTREVLRCLLEGVRWLGDPSGAAAPAGKSGISQARTRLAPRRSRRCIARRWRPWPSRALRARGIAAGA